MSKKQDPNPPGGAEGAIRFLIVCVIIVFATCAMVVAIKGAGGK